MREHMEGKCRMQFMGTHELHLIADTDWDESGETARVSGAGKLKMIKWLTYQFSESTHAWRDDDGTIHFEGGLKSQFGNGELGAFLQLSPNGEVTGHVQILRGLKLPFKGERVV